MNLRYLIAERIVFEPLDNCIYAYQAEGEEITKYDIGENSKEVLLELIKSDSYVSTEQLLENIWRKKRKIEVDTTSVRQAVSKLRKNFKFVYSEVDVIKTIPRKGYCLDANVTVLREAPDSVVLSKKKIRLGIMFIMLLVFSISFVTASHFFSLYSTKNFISFIKLEGISLSYAGLKVVRAEHHHFDQDLVPLTEQCITKLNLSKADTIVVDSTTEEYLSLTVFYEKSIKKPVTFRLVLSENGGLKCGGI